MKDPEINSGWQNLLSSLQVKPEPQIYIKILCHSFDISLIVLCYVFGENKMTPKTFRTKWDYHGMERHFRTIFFYSNGSYVQFICKG